MSAAELQTELGRSLESQLGSLGYRVRTGPDRDADGQTLRAWAPSPLVAMLARNVPSSTAIDLGCGGGRDAVFLAARGWKVTAVDSLSDCVERGRGLEESVPALHPIEWICADVRGEFAVPSAKVYLFIRFFDAGVWARLAESAEPGAIVAVQTFSERHRAVTGHPRSERTVWLSTTPDFGWHVRYSREKGPFQYRILQKPEADDVNSVAHS